MREREGWVEGRAMGRGPPEEPGVSEEEEEEEEEVVVVVVVGDERDTGPKVYTGVREEQRRV